MRDDIVAQLRDEAARCNASPCDCQCPNLLAAADEIERLRARLDLVMLAKVQAEGVYINALEKKQSEIERLSECNDDLQARVEWLINTYATIEDGVFTFPDGETWKEADRG